MVLKWMEGFEHYGPTGSPGGGIPGGSTGALLWISHRWSVTASNNTGYPTSTGRIAGTAVFLTISNKGETILFESEFLGDENEWIIGFGFKMNTASNGDIFELLDSNFVQMGIRVSGTNLQLYNDNGIIDTGGTALVNNTWYYIEIKTFIDATEGTYVLRINKQLEVFGTADTDASTRGVANAVVFYGKNGGWHVDDIYVCDGTGDENNDLLGNVRVLPVFPKADGSKQDWAAISSNNGAQGNNPGPVCAPTCTAWQVLDKINPNQWGASAGNPNVQNPDTRDRANGTYVSSTTAGDESLFSMNSIGEADNKAVHGVQLLMYATKMGPGTRRLRTLTDPGVTEVEGEDLTVVDDYTYMGEILDTNPDTGELWLNSEINNTQFGFKLEI